MKCHYEVLEVSRDANSDDIKKSYRKLAIKWHPDKNLDNTEEATEQFQLIQQAFEVLSDPHERAWYDDHREAILKGKSGDPCDDESLDLYQYFTPSCFKGFGDDEKGFYLVYREVFNKIAAEDSEFLTEEDSDFEVPCFGKSDSSYEEVKSFYDYWQSYYTKKNYSWLDSFDTRQAPNRRVARAMEKENKKVRDKARKARSDEVKELVKFVRKRDKRVQAYAQHLQEVSAEKAKKSEEKRIEKIKARKSELASQKEEDWSKFSNLENELKNIEANLASEFGDTVSPENSEDEEIIDQNLYCVACNKLFKTPKAFQNHESSKKHKENVQILKQKMQDSDNNDSELDVDISAEDDCGDNNDSTKYNIDVSDKSDDTDSPNEDINEEENANVATEVTNDDVDNDCEFSEAEDTGKVPLFCKSCGRWFKTVKAVNNHKTSQAHIKNSKLYKQILRTLGSDTEADTDNDCRTSSAADSGSENDSFLEEFTNGKGDFKEDLERVMSKFDELEKIERLSLKNDIEKICAEFDDIIKHNEEEAAANKSNKKKKKSTNKSSSKQFDESDDDFDFSLGQSKKQKRKQSRQKILSKSKEKPNTSHSQRLVNESETNENYEPKKVSIDSQNCVSLGDDNSTVYSGSQVDKQEINSKASTATSKINKKKPSDKDSSVNATSDLSTSCAVCKATFPSKNKLFSHLTKTGHSVYLPEVSSKNQEVDKDSGKKGKNKKRNKC